MASVRYSLRSFLISPEEKTIIKKIVPKDAPVGHNVEVNSVMGVIVDIFLNSICKSSMVSQEIRNSFGAHKGPAQSPELNENIRYAIHRLSWEIKCKCSKGFDEITQNIFKLLETFNWEEKAVLVLAAFAMSYGEFWFTISPIAGNPLSSLFMFNQLPCLRGSSPALKSRFEAQANLIKSMLDLAKCMVELKDYFSKIQPILPIRVACYRIVMSVVTCLFYNMELAKMGTEYTGSDTEVPKLNACNEELQTILAYLKELQKIYEYENFSASYEDISIKIKKFFAETEKCVLWRYSVRETALTASEVGLDAVKGRSVAFFISDFDFDVNMPEFQILVKTHNKIKGGEHKNEFEIVWIPMSNQSIADSEMKTKILDRATKMPWLSFCYPTTIKNSFSDYIRESWHFQKKPILMVMDSKGTVTHTNAIPMVTNWHELAYPFTSSREEELWRDKGRTVEDLVVGIDSQITTMIEQKKLVCLYGGDDWDSIKTFVETMKTVMGKARVPVELIYIGINGRREKMQKIMTAFRKEPKEVSKCWTEEKIRSFWFQFQSTYNSWMQCRTSSLEKDDILKKLSTFASGDYGWAMMMFKEHDRTVVASEKQIMGFLNRFENWMPKLRTPADIFLVLESDMNEKKSSYEHCTHTTIPVIARPSMEIEHCLECGSIMEMYYLYKCCTE